ncbi:MAG: hypothetical protein J6Y78_06880 [Paludibacteraceae bacterium]|nr:hypothetical protein [Paludibacteraceae bacterium]
MPQQLIDMTGERYGRLVVIRRADHNTENNKPKWLCRCDCGNEIETTRRRLINGMTKSCGCYRREFAREQHSTHGLSKTNHKPYRLYGIWAGIKDRCCNPNSKYWRRYGERGITVCPEWINDYVAFHEWSLANGYSDNLTLDRRDNDKGYSPDNCRWVSYSVQENNRGNNILFDIDGQIKTLAQIAKAEGIPRSQAEKKYKENRIYGK